MGAEAILLAAALPSGAALVWDLRSRTIPNVLPLALLGLALARLAMAVPWPFALGPGAPEPLLGKAALGLAFVAALFFAWRAGKIGGGDFKLIVASLALFFGELTAFLLVLALCLVLQALAWRLWRTSADGRIPAGAAIGSANILLIGVLVLPGA